jgi:hypothetical protein
MAVALSQIEWIISRYAVLRDVGMAPDYAAPALEVEVSIGVKPKDAGGAVLTDPHGIELWQSAAKRTYQASLRTVLGFMALCQDPAFPYRPPAEPSLFLDEYIVAPIYQFTQWAFDTGHWKLAE